MKVCAHHTPAAGGSTTQCRNLLGPLSPDVQQRLAAVLSRPTADTWDDASSIIICHSPITTLWQAWLAICPGAPKTGRRSTDMAENAITEWSQIPDPFTLYRAIKTALSAATK